MPSSHESGLAIKRLREVASDGVYGIHGWTSREFEGEWYVSEDQVERLADAGSEFEALAPAIVAYIDALEADKEGAPAQGRAGGPERPQPAPASSTEAPQSSTDVEVEA